MGDDDLTEVASTADTWDEAGRMLGCHRTTAMRRLRAAGLSIRRRRQSATRSDRIELPMPLLTALYATHGLTAAAIATRCGVSETTVRQRLAESGTRMRPPGVASWPPSAHCEEPMRAPQTIRDRHGEQIEREGAIDVSDVLAEIDAHGCVQVGEW
jgi:AraC-like DNA-binding protein